MVRATKLLPPLGGSFRNQGSEGSSGHVNNTCHAFRLPLNPCGNKIKLKSSPKGEGFSPFPEGDNRFLSAMKLYAMRDALSISSLPYSSTLA